jgi:hypothetical protein
MSYEVMESTQATPPLLAKHSSWECSATIFLMRKTPIVECKNRNTKKQLFFSYNLMGAEKWVASNEFWVCSASSFVCLKCGCERKSSLWEERERERYKCTKEQNAHLLWTRLTRRRHELFMSFEFIVQTWSVCEKEETTVEDICGSKKRIMGIQKNLKRTKTNTHTHTP